MKNCSSSLLWAQSVKQIITSFTFLMLTAQLPAITKYVIHPWNHLNSAFHHPFLEISVTSWLSIMKIIASSVWHLCWAVLGLCIFQVQITQGKGKETYISLASEKIPRSVEKGDETRMSQDQLFKLWTNDNDKFYELTKDKTFVLGSQVNLIKFDWETQIIRLKEPVHYNTGDIGFFETLLTAYNKHWVLRTSPEDWWMAIR